MSGIHEICAEAVRRLRERCPGKAIALGDDCFIPNFVALCGGDAEGCVVTTPAIPITTDPLARADESEATQGYFRSSVVATSVALQAHSLAPTLRGAKLGAFIRSRFWKTPFGPVAFDAAGEMRGILYRTLTIRDGRFVHLIGDQPG